MLPIVLFLFQYPKILPGFLYLFAISNDDFIFVECITVICRRIFSDMSYSNITKIESPQVILYTV